MTWDDESDPSGTPTPPVPGEQPVSRDSFLDMLKKVSGVEVEPGITLMIGSDEKQEVFSLVVRRDNAAKLAAQFSVMQDPAIENIARDTIRHYYSEWVWSVMSKETQQKALEPIKAAIAKAIERLASSLSVTK
jgi:hypothetical protein